MNWTGGNKKRLSKKQEDEKLKYQKEFLKNVN